jgi:hypothetical protein
MNSVDCKDKSVLAYFYMKRERLMQIKAIIKWTFMDQCHASIEPLLFSFFLSFQILCNHSQSFKSHLLRVGSRDNHHFATKTEGAGQKCCHQSWESKWEKYYCTESLGERWGVQCINASDIGREDSNIYLLTTIAVGKLFFEMFTFQLKNGRWWKRRVGIPT